jgi:hypothetical protein
MGKMNGAAEPVDEEDDFDWNAPLSLEFLWALIAASRERQGKPGDLPAKINLGENYKIVHSCCEGLPLCARGHSVVGPDNEWWDVFCFAERQHAEKFKERFGGEWFDPTKRGRGQGWMIWRR